MQNDRYLLAMTGRYWEVVPGLFTLFGTSVKACSSTSQYTGPGLDKPALQINVWDYSQCIRRVKTQWHVKQNI